MLYNWRVWRGRLTVLTTRQAQCARRSKIELSSFEGSIFEPGTHGRS